MYYQKTNQIMRKTVISFIFILMSINLWGYDFKIDKIYYNFKSDSISVSVAPWPGSWDYTGKIVIPPKIIYKDLLNLIVISYCLIFCFAIDYTK